MATVVTAERVGDTHLSSKEDGSPRSAERQYLLHNRDPSLEPSKVEAGSDNHSGGELNNTESDEDDKEPRPMKRKKRPSSSDDNLTPRKRKRRL